MKRAGNPKAGLRPTYIRVWREYRDLSQDRLVERVREFIDGFSKSTLSRMETGKQAYTQPVLEALADALSCTPSDLLNRDPRIDDAVAELNAILRKASVARQREILDYARFLLSKTGTED